MGSPSGCLRHEIPEATKADEKGRHEGNTAVVTAFFDVGGNMGKDTAGREFLLTAFIYF